MLKSSNELTVYAVDGADTTTPFVMVVKSGSRHAGSVDVVVYGKTYTVNGADLVNAVRNAQNT